MPIGSRSSASFVPTQAVSSRQVSPNYEERFLLFILGSLLSVANAADYGSEHQGFVKVQQALDYAEFQLVVNKALEQLRLFQKVRFIVIQDPSVVSVKDDGELAKRLETFHRFCASGGLISFLDDRKVQLYVGSL